MNPPIEVALAVLVAFVGGSMPFAVWTGRVVVHRDVRAVGDGNPGAMNAFLAGGATLGVSVLLLDVTKGVVPVVLAKDVLALDGWSLAAVAVLTVAGSAFSPFLGFRGGKALAATLGTWIGLTHWTIPLIAVVTVVAATLLIEPDGWAVAIALAAMLVGVLLWLPSGSAVATLLLQAAILLWKQRWQLARRPRRRRTGWRPS